MSAEGLPTYEELMLPVLRLIGEGKQTIAECLPALQRQFALSDEQMELPLPSGGKTYITNRAHWARTYMKHAGLVEPIKRAHYMLSPAGQALLRTNPTAIDKDMLKTYPAFAAWLSKDNTVATAIQGASEEPDTSETPQELIESAFKVLHDALAEELLEHLLLSTPAHFEQVIVDLLIAMGYGSGRAEMGRAIGKSGDGGIDGIINEDKLGLDAVYVQAKRYKPENTIGRPAVQAFVGSLTGERAKKGVFVTTSAFTKDAWDYVGRIEQRVVLIDGARLARLMIDHGVGVRTSATYVIRRIDEDYFSVD